MEPLAHRSRLSQLDFSWSSPILCCQHCEPRSKIASVDLSNDWYFWSLKQSSIFTSPTMEVGVLAQELERYGVHGASALSRWQYCVSVSHDHCCTPSLSPRNVLRWKELLCFTVVSKTALLIMFDCLLSSPSSRAWICSPRRRWSCRSFHVCVMAVDQPSPLHCASSMRHSRLVVEVMRNLQSRMLPTSTLVVAPTCRNSRQSPQSLVPLLLVLPSTPLKCHGCPRPRCCRCARRERWLYSPSVAVEVTGALAWEPLTLVVSWTWPLCW